MTPEYIIELRINAPYKLCAAILRMDIGKAREVLCAQISSDSKETSCLLDPNLRDDEAKDAWCYFRSNFTKSTFLHEAANCSSIASGNGNNPAIVLMLMGAGAKIDAVDIYGNTPLHMAALANNAPVCAILIRAGANPDIRNNEGLTPLHLCTINNSSDSCRLILALGGNPNIASNLGESPLDLANRLKKEDVAISLQVALNRNAVLEIVHEKLLSSLSRPQI
jgi:ankyrin repeat protein